MSSDNKAFAEHDNDRDTILKKLSYGIIRKFENGTTLWYEPVTDDLDGFVLRHSNSNIRAVYSAGRETYIMDKDDPSIIQVFMPQKP